MERASSDTVEQRKIMRSEGEDAERDCRANGKTYGQHFCERSARVSALRIYDREKSDDRDVQSANGDDGQEHRRLGDEGVSAKTFRPQLRADEKGNGESGKHRNSPHENRKDRCAMRLRQLRRSSHKVRKAGEPNHEREGPARPVKQLRPA